MHPSDLPVLMAAASVHHPNIHRRFVAIPEHVYVPPRAREVVQ